MNAYELADTIKTLLSNPHNGEISFHPTPLKQIIEMLRQQADRIAELEKQTKPLSDEEIVKCLDLARKSAKKGYEIHAFAKAIEKRHGIK